MFIANVRTSKEMGRCFNLFHFAFSLEMNSLIAKWLIASYGWQALSSDGAVSR